MPTAWLSFLRNIGIASAEPDAIILRRRARELRDAATQCRKNIANGWDWCNVTVSFENDRKISIEEAEAYAEELDRRALIKEHEIAGKTPTKPPVMIPTEIPTPVNTPTPTPSYGLSDNGLQFIANHEGFRPKLYNDAGGHCTIGYGHLVHSGPCNGKEPAEFKAGITNARGLEVLRSDVDSAVKAVNKNVKVKLNQNQFDAIVSFTFNRGAEGFSTSTLLKELNAGNYNNVPTELNRYVYSGGKKIPGLVNRRKDEGALFMTPV